MAIDPITAITIGSTVLDVVGGYDSGKKYRARLATQRSFSQLKGLSDWNNTKEAIINDLKENFAVQSSSGVVAEYSGSFKAVQQEIQRLGKKDLNLVDLMTQSMTDEFNYRIDESRRADNLNFLKSVATVGLDLNRLKLNNQHKEIIEKSMEREKKVINKYPVSYRKGTQRFTTRRDLFGINPKSWEMKTFGSMSKPSKSISKYKKTYNDWFMKTREADY